MNEFEKSIRELLDFLNRGRESTPIMYAIEQSRLEDVRFVTMQLLSWLRARSQVDRGRRLRLPDDQNCIQAIELIVNAMPGLAENLYVADGEVDFKDCVSNELRGEMLDFAARNYIPKVRHPRFRQTGRVRRP